MSSFQTSTFDKPRLFFSTYTGLEDTSAAADINIITFLTLLQKAKIPILPLTWQSSRQLLGRGATSQVNQSLVDIETSFAFKRVAEKDRLEKTDQEIFRRLINEVYMLRHKAVVNHPNILELQGICWDVPLKNKHPAPERAEPGFLDTDKVWPVLVFQKAHFEDLYTFAQRPIGQALGVPERWKICLDIGTAMAHMQSHYVIHGDIKPENILIFKGKDGAFTAKVADFGFSIWDGYDSASVSVPQSWPWYAPETNEYPQLSYSEAIKTDVFSYGLLCLWFMFEKHLSSAVLPAEAGSLSGTSPSSLRLLDHLKRNNALVLYATQLVMTEEALPAETKERLKAFFSGSLASDPGVRDADIHQSLKRVIQLPAQLQTADLFTTEKYLLRNDDFEIIHSLHQLYYSDYRVRSYIVQELEALVQKNATVELSTQLAICYTLGFGASNPGLQPKDIKYSNQDMVAQMQKVTDSDSSDSPEYAGTLYRDLATKGSHSPMEIAEYYEAHGVLEAAERVTRKDIHSLRNTLGSDSHVVLALQDLLSSLLSHQQRWLEAEELEAKIMATRIKKLGEEHATALDNMSSLALVYSNQGKWEKAKELHTKVMSISQRTLGPNHASTLASMANLAVAYWKQGQWKEAQELQTQILDDRQRVLGDEHPTTLNIMLNLASTYRSQGLLKEAEDLEVKALEQRKRLLGQDHPATLAVMSNLAVTYSLQGHWKQAESLETTVLEKRRRILGPEHPDTLTTLGNLASTYQDLAKWEGAEILQKELVAVRERILGADHPDTLGSQQALGKIYYSQGRWEEAEHLLDRSLMAFLRTQGPDHPHTLSSMTSLASAYWVQGKWISAEILQSSTLERYTRLLGRDHPDTLTTISNLAATYFVMGRLEEAQSLQVEVMENSIRQLGPEHPDTLSSLANLASTWHAMEQWAEAESLQRRLVRIATRVLGPEHPETLINIYNLAITCQRQGRYDEARRLLSEVLDVRQRVLGVEHPYTLETVGDLASLCELPDDTDTEPEDLLTPV